MDANSVAEAGACVAGSPSGRFKLLATIKLGRREVSEVFRFAPATDLATVADLLAGAFWLKVGSAFRWSLPKEEDHCEATSIYVVRESQTQSQSSSKPGFTLLAPGHGCNQR